MKIQNYSAVGFVESLIAIAVAGIASIVLMTIAVRTTGQIVRNEIEGSLTEKAIEGGAMVRQIVADHNLRSEDDFDSFPSLSTNIYNCFAMTGDTQTPSFVKSGEIFDVVCKYDSVGRDDCLSSHSQDPEIFRVFCIMPDSVQESGLAVGKIVTGLSECSSGNNSGKCKIQDYEYYLGLKLK